MKIEIIIVLLSLSLLSCQGKYKEVTQTEQIETQEQEQKQLHWWELPQYVDPKDETYKEIMKGREEKYQQVMRKMSEAGLNAPPAYGFAESDYGLNDLNLMNELYYDGLKSMGFQFPSEEVFNQRIKEFYGVDLTQDQSKNARVRRVGDFLILAPKLYVEKTYKEVPMLVFSYPCIVFDMKRRYYADNLRIVSEKRDDYGETYYRIGMSSLDLAYNNYIFYESKAAFVELHQYAVTDFTVLAGNDNLPIDLLKDYQRKQLKEFRDKNEGMFRDYRMYERLLFARDFNGNLKPRIKMLEAMVELAKEDSDYAKIPLDYYSRQLIGVYAEGEYVTSLGGSIDPYKNPEPYYTKEERAKIWAYLAYYEAQVLEYYIENNGDLKAWVATTFADTNQQITGYFYQIGKGHDFYGLDFSKVEEFFRDERGEDWEAIITSWEEVEPEKV